MFSKFIYEQHIYHMPMFDSIEQVASTLIKIITT